MNKYMLQFLRELLTSIFKKMNDERMQQIFLKISAMKNLSHLVNALK